jgi:hypothetical protein
LGFATADEANDTKPQALEREGLLHVVESSVGASATQQVSCPVPCTRFSAELPASVAPHPIFGIHTPKLRITRAP